MPLTSSGRSGAGHARNRCNLETLGPGRRSTKAGSASRDSMRVSLRSSLGNKHGKKQMSVEMQDTRGELDRLAPMLDKTPLETKSIDRGLSVSQRNRDSSNIPGPLDWAKGAHDAGWPDWTGPSLSRCTQFPPCCWSTLDRHWAQSPKSPRDDRAIDAWPSKVAPQWASKYPPHAPVQDRRFPFQLLPNRCLAKHRAQIILE